MEWFSRLPTGIKTFKEIMEAFHKNYNFNMGTDVSLEELSTLKQRKGDLFAFFLQRW